MMCTEAWCRVARSARQDERDVDIAKTTRPPCQARSRNSRRPWLFILDKGVCGEVSAKRGRSNRQVASSSTLHDHDAVTGLRCEDDRALADSFVIENRDHDLEALC